MALIEVNGWPLEARSLSFSRVLHGKSLTMRLGNSHRTIGSYFSISGQVFFENKEDADTLHGILHGLVDDWKLEGAAISNFGILQEDGFIVDPVNINLTTDFNGGLISGTGTCTFDARLNGRWCVEFARYSGAGTGTDSDSYEFYHCFDDGTTYLNGAYSSTSWPAFFTESDGAFGINTTGSRHVGMIRLYRFRPSESYIATCTQSARMKIFYSDFPNFELKISKPAYALTVRGVSASISYDDNPGCSDSFSGTVDFVVEGVSLEQ